MRKMVILLLFGILAAALSPSAGSMSPVRAAAPINDNLTDKDLPAAIAEWIRTLAQQEHFSSWKQPQMAWKSYPLGTGMHGWLVILRAGGKEIGYLVIGATESNQLRLVEYGVGAYPLFSDITLYHTLSDRKLLTQAMSYFQFSTKSGLLGKERIYLHPLSTYWKITLPNHEVIYLDGKTGELLPLTSEWIAAEQAAMKPYSFAADTATTSNTSHSSRLRTTFNPYDTLPWLSGPPSAIKNEQALIAQLATGSKITAVAKLFGGQLLYAFPMLGSQRWNTSVTYAAIDQEGLRFIPAQLVLAKLQLYPERSI